MINFYKLRLNRKLAMLGSCALMLLMSSTISIAQEITVSGNVTSETGEPLPGVNVLVKSSSQGTVTTIEGN